jgi:hypothetical protein
VHSLCETTIACFCDFTTTTTNQYLLIERVCMMTLEQYQQLTRSKNYLRGKSIYKHWKQSPDKEFFTLTMYAPHAKFTSFSNIDERENCIGRAWVNLERRINRVLDNNYKRHSQNRLSAFWVFEHMNKRNTQLVQPHIHATLAIPESRLDRFTDALTDTIDSKGNHAYTLKKHLTETPRDTLRVIMHKPNSLEEAYAWMGYTIKQQFNQQ